MTRERREEGYVLFGIVIMVVILGIAMTAAVPLWQKIVQREREQELIWRGYQYMQAIELYQRKFPGAFPPSVELLVEQKFLRKEYEDPMVEDGSFRLIRQLSPELQPGAQLQQAAGQASGISALNRSQAQLRTPGQTPGGSFQSSMGRSPSDGALGGIVGVASSSEETTFYKVPGKEKYKDWLFVFGMPSQQVVQPGQPANMATNLPPPPGNTAFRFGAMPMTPGQGQQPGAAPPGMTPSAPTGPGGRPQPHQPQQRRRNP